MTAPVGMGDGSGKWRDPDQVMQYTVIQAQALLNAVAVAGFGSSPAAAGQKRTPAGGGAGQVNKSRRRFQKGPRWVRRKTLSGPRLRGTGWSPKMYVFIAVRGVTLHMTVN